MVHMHMVKMRTRAITLRTMVPDLMLEVAINRFLLLIYLANVVKETPPGNRCRVLLGGTDAIVKVALVNDGHIWL